MKTGISQETRAENAQSRQSQSVRIILALQELRGVGPKRALSALGPYSGALANDDPEYIFAEIASNLGAKPPACYAAWILSGTILSKCIESNIGAVSILDSDFPTRLRGIDNPPTVLYVKGDYAALDAARETLVVAIVGTRVPTEYGARATRTLTQTAVEQGATVVSGLAYGCDTLAHQACVDANGTTVAVMAQGLDKIYPKPNSTLAHEILEGGGCLVGEHFPGSKVGRWAFTARNRIQSGLADCVFAVETGMNGGTMHTVEFARQQGRQLGCLRHPRQAFPPDSGPGGNRKIINEGWATPIYDSQEFIHFLQAAPVSRNQDAIQESLL